MNTLICHLRSCAITLYDQSRSFFYQSSSYQELNLHDCSIESLNRNEIFRWVCTSPTWQAPDTQSVVATLALRDFWLKRAEEVLKSQSSSSPRVCLFPLTDWLEMITAIFLTSSRRKKTCEVVTFKKQAMRKVAHVVDAKWLHLICSRSLRPFWSDQGLIVSAVMQKSFRAREADRWE